MRQLGSGSGKRRQKEVKLTENDQVMGTSPVDSSAIASKAPVERSSDSDEEQPGHLERAGPSVLGDVCIAGGKLTRRRRSP